MATGTRARAISTLSGGKELAGELTLPDDPLGVVLFAHGSGSSRFSPRNRFVAERLNEARLATLLMDLLTRDEAEADERTGSLRFDISLLADRTSAALRWLHGEDATKQLRTAVFGASTGAAAALIAAAEHPTYVDAVVSRGGRPDLARAHLPRVRAPVLLIVGGRDTEVLQLNREAYALLPFEKELYIVPGATHLFEEPGALEEVADYARAWLIRHLSVRAE